MSYYKFQRQLCITYVTGVGIMQQVDPLPSKHSSCHHRCLRKRLDYVCRVASYVDR